MFFMIFNKNDTSSHFYKPHPVHSLTHFYLGLFSRFLILNPLLLSPTHPQITITYLWTKLEDVEAENW
ncbi:hypothetical protein L1887_37997 [Cichorium endivia]|nr:hypothetical protein L1887_37997 [Cichorium endivia]